MILCFFYNATPTSEIYTLSLHDALPIFDSRPVYDGRIVHLSVDTVRFPDGSIGELEMIRHSGVSVVFFVLSDPQNEEDRKSTRLNSSHSQISYAVFCLKKKKKKISTREL